MTKKIRVAVVGVGNCASALIQGVSYYTRRQQGGKIPGVMFDSIGGYAPTDIEFVAAWDVTQGKVGSYLKNAIYTKPNVVNVFEPEIMPGVCDNVIVRRGPTIDGIAPHMNDFHHTIKFEEDKDHKPDTMNDVVDVLIGQKVDVILNYLPVGSQEATEFYMECALAAKVNVVNCIPVFIASDPVWAQRFLDEQVTIIGDDMRSQVGASVLSQVLQELAFDRGAVVKFHQQLNVGGNTDFANMMDATRVKSKKISKENVIKAQNVIRDIPVDDDSIFAGPSSFIPYLKDNKVAYITMKLESFGGAQIDIDVKLSVQDSENSAGVVIDAIRHLKVANELGIFGPLFGPSAWTQKTPPYQMPYAEAKHECELLALRMIPDAYTTTRRETTGNREVKDDRKIQFIDIGDMSPVMADRVIQSIFDTAAKQRGTSVTELPRD